MYSAKKADGLPFGSTTSDTLTEANVNYSMYLAVRSP